MGRKGRKPNYTDQQLEVAAYTIFRNTGEWPAIDDFKKEYTCSFERARRAINEAYATAVGAPVEATYFEALAVYAGFFGLDDALAYMKALQKDPLVPKNKSRRNLRAAVILHCPQHYSHRATADELLEILQEQKELEDKYQSKTRQKITIDTRPFPSRFSLQEYGSERLRRNRRVADDTSEGWGNVKRAREAEEMMDQLGVRTEVEAPGRDVWVNGPPEGWQWGSDEGGDPRDQMRLRVEWRGRR